MSFPSSFKVDGDTDSPAVQREFEKVIGEKIQRVAKAMSTQGPSTKSVVAGNLYDRSQRQPHPQRDRRMERQEIEEQDAIVHDLEDGEEFRSKPVATVSQKVSLANGHVKRNAVTLNGYGPPTQMNGHIPNGKPTFRKMLEEADSYPIHSYM